MKAYMNTEYPYIKFLEIAEYCRNVLIENTLEMDSDEFLYDALLSDADSKICDVKFKLYETIWLELHWEKITELIDSLDGSLSDNKKTIQLFIKQFADFIKNWDFSEFEVNTFDQIKNILEILIQADNEWEKQLFKVKNAFNHDKKILKNKLRDLSKEVK